MAYSSALLCIMRVTDQTGILILWCTCTPGPPGYAYGLVRLSSSR